MKITNPDSKLKAIGCMIFAGSATIGTMKSNYHVDRVLEISDDITQQNAYAFTKNYPDVPIVIPTEWENPEYLAKLKEEKFDMLYANCPCSGLSQINRNSSADNKTNNHFYRVFDAISGIQPKTFIIENAPTLIKLGYPILKDLTHVLGDKYRFTILRDQAANHNTAMKRMRTMIVGWNREYFDQIPLFHADKQPLFTVKDAIGDLYDAPFDKATNHVCIEKREWGQYEHLYHLIPEGKTSLMAFIDIWDDIKDKFEEKDRTYIEKSKKRIEAGEGIWNKSPYKSFENGHSPSMTSLSKVIHPVLNRQYTIREYARMMGFPDDFIFYPEECATPVIQCIAQGVPVNFFQYVTKEIREALNGNRMLIENSEDKILNFEHHIKMKYQSFTQIEIDAMSFLDVDKTSLTIPE
jgi:site-specific DNA-cytosine methylase